MNRQDRPFFRKQIKLITTSKTSFYKSAGSYLSSSNSKLTQHKFKSTGLKDNLPVIISRPLNSNWLLSKVRFNFVGTAQLSIVENYLGISYKLPHIYGFSFGNYLSFVRVGNHKILHPFLVPQLTGRQLPISNLAVGSKVYFTAVPKIGTLTSDNVLEVRGSNNLRFAKSNVMLGTSAKSHVPSVGVTSRVRGIAKNPVDHPNGGRANTKGSFKTP